MNPLKHRPAWLFRSILILFFVPLVLAWYAFSHRVDLVSKTVNKGVLMKPMLRIQELPLTSYNLNYSFNPGNWQNHWVLLYFKGNNCDQSCFRVLYEIGQIRKALGKDQTKILTAYVAVRPNNVSNPSMAILRQLPRIYLLKTEDLDLATFLQNLWLTGQILQSGQLFLVDPQGYVMMRYPSDVNPEDVFHDLQRLLSLGEA